MSVWRYDSIAHMCHLPSHAYRIIDCQVKPPLGCHHRSGESEVLLIASFITGFHIRLRTQVLRRRYTMRGTAVQPQQGEAANGVYGDRADECRIEAWGFALHEIMVWWPCHTCAFVWPRGSVDSVWEETGPRRGVTMVSPGRPVIRLIRKPPRIGPAAREPGQSGGSCQTTIRPLCSQRAGQRRRASTRSPLEKVGYMLQPPTCTRKNSDRANTRSSSGNNVQARMITPDGICRISAGHSSLRRADVFHSYRTASAGGTPAATCAGYSAASAPTSPGTLTPTRIAAASPAETTR